MRCILVFKFRSAMADDALIERMESRLPLFREVDGLEQKYYCREPDTGAFCGVYLFASSEQASAYRASATIHGIPEALQVEDEIRIEQLDLLMALQPDQYVVGAPAAP